MSVCVCGGGGGGGGGGLGVVKYMQIAHHILNASTNMHTYMYVYSRFHSTVAEDQFFQRPGGIKYIPHFLK